SEKALESESRSPHRSHPEAHLAPALARGARSSQFLNPGLLQEVKMVSLALTRPCAILWTLLLVLGLTSFQPVGSEREAGRGFAQTKVIGRARWLTDLQGNLLEPILDLRVEAGATDPVVEEVRVEWHIPGTVGGVYPGKIQARRRRTLLGDPNQAWYPDPI